MQFRQLSAEHVHSHVTYRAYDLLEPVLDTLHTWRNNTVVIKKPWQDYRVDTDGETVTIDGYPMHPYTQRRITQYLLGIGVSHKEVWRDNPDLLSQALYRSAVFHDAPVIQTRVIDNQVVYVTDFPHELGDHADYFQVMAEAFTASVKSGRVTMALVGYIVDPVWVHVRVVYLSPTRRTFHTGIQMDSNYLFSKQVRGRASYGLCAWDQYWESMLTMDNWWSARTPEILHNKSAQLFEVFDKKTRAYAPRMRLKATTVLKTLSSLSRKKASKPWRQAVVLEVGKRYLGQSRLREVLLRADDAGLSSPVDLAFALARAMRDELPLDRRIGAERHLAQMLKTQVRQ